MEYSEIAALKENILASLHCALPGTVVSYDEEAQTAVIQPAICRVPQRQNVRDGSLVPRAWNGENDVTFHQPSSATGGGFETPACTIPSFRSRFRLYNCFTARAW